MKKMMYLLLMVAAAVWMAVAVAAVSPEACPTGVSGEATWTLKGDTMYITGQGILSGVSNADCQPWEYFQDQICHVVVEEGVTLIGDVIFAHTYNLKTVTIADSVKEICTGAFRNCYALEEVKLPANLETLGNFAFAYCEKLGSAELPDSLAEMGEGVFMGCSALAGIRLPDDLYEIGQMNFDSCMALTEVTIPSGVGFLRHASFPNCFNLKKVFFEGDQPYTNGDPFYMGPEDLVIYCYSDAKGWDEPVFYTYPVVKLEREGVTVEDIATEKPQEFASGGEEHTKKTESGETDTGEVAESIIAIGAVAADGVGTTDATHGNSSDSGNESAEKQQNQQENGDAKADEVVNSTLSGVIPILVGFGSALFAYFVASFVFGKGRLKR